MIFLAKKSKVWIVKEFVEPFESTLYLQLFAFILDTRQQYSPKYVRLNAVFVNKETFNGSRQLNAGRKNRKSLHVMVFDFQLLWTLLQVCRLV